MSIKYLVIKHLVAYFLALAVVYSFGFITGRIASTFHYQPRGQITNVK